MNQSSVIGASLVIAFVIFVIYKGQLPCYLQVMGIATASGCPQNLQPAGCTGTSTNAGTSAGSGSGVTVSPVVNIGNPFRNVPGGGGGGIGIGGIGIGLGGIGIGLGGGVGPI